MFNFFIIKSVLFNEQYRLDSNRTHCICHSIHNSFMKKSKLTLDTFHQLIFSNNFLSFITIRNPISNMYRLQIISINPFGQCYSMGWSNFELWMKMGWLVQPILIQNSKWKVDSFFVSGQCTKITIGAITDFFHGFQFG